MLFYLSLLDGFIIALAPAFVNTFSVFILNKFNTI